MTVERIYRRLGRRIRVRRKRLGLSQETLADAVGMIRTSIVNIEAGRQRILFHQTQKFARALGVEPAVLLRGVW